MKTKSHDFLDKLAALRAAHCEQMPTPQLSVLVRLTARLRRSGILQHSLQVGETAPDFRIARPDGTITHLYALLERGPVVINFFRGLWCAYCREEIEAYEAVQDTLAAHGCQYLAISPQPVDPAGTIDIVFDEGNEIARQFELVYALNDEELGLFEELGVTNLMDATEMPLPATYLVAPDRTIAYRFVDADFRSRCCPDDLMAEIGTLTNAS